MIIRTPAAMPEDRLENLLQRFSVRARLFHHGPLCGVHDFDAQDGIGQLHLIKQGGVEVRHRQAPTLQVARPSLLFYPRPMGHRFITDDKTGADMACASVQFNAGYFNPLSQALPPIVAMPLADVPEAGAVINLLFAEAFGGGCGRAKIVDRLFEVVLIFIIRRLMQDGAVDTGLFAGLADPALGRAIVAMHEHPDRAWTLELLCSEAGLSRTGFAERFKRVVGQGPGEYLTRWRISLAQDLLRQGKALKHVAAEVGYGSEVALSRAIKSYTGLSPREWRKRVESP
jgi:AraC-like DNA-binding protein